MGAVWLTGSALLGDLTPDSDIDSVTLLAGPARSADHAALESVHAALAERFPGVRYDTTYLDIASLARPAAPGTVVPQSVDGQLVLYRPGGEVHAVAWLTLPHAVPVTGTSPEDVPIAADPVAARRHSSDNLRTYWCGSFVPELRAALAGRGPGDPLDHPDTVVWVVLGAPRLAMFLDPAAEYAGPIPSKSEAGQWVVARRPGHAHLEERALACRHGADVVFTVSDALAAADLVESLV